MCVCKTLITNITTEVELNSKLRKLQKDLIIFKTSVKDNKYADSNSYDYTNNISPLIKYYSILF